MQRFFRSCTPHIDRIAQEGLFLRQSYANSAVCSATRTGLITGRYQYRLRVGVEEPISSNNGKVGLDPEHPALPSMLRDQGYRTSLVGKWHLGLSDRFDPLHSGYQSFYGVPFGAADYFRHRKSDGIGRSEQLFDGDQSSDDKDDRPFLLSLHYTAPHWPWEGPEDEAVAATPAGSVAYGNIGADRY